MTERLFVVGEDRDTADAGNRDQRRFIRRLFSVDLRRVGLGVRGLCCRDGVDLGGEACSVLRDLDRRALIRFRSWDVVYRRATRG